MGWCRTAKNVSPLERSSSCTTQAKEQLSTQQKDCVSWQGHSQNKSLMPAAAFQLQRVHQSLEQPMLLNESLLDEKLL